MVYDLYSIYDDKARVYSPPRRGINREVFIREIRDELADAKDSFKQHAGDYKMFHVGRFDDYNAAFEPICPPEMVCGLDELV